MSEAAVASTPVTPADLARITRAEQGLPPAIEDAATLQRIARVVGRRSSSSS